MRDVVTFFDIDIKILQNMQKYSETGLGNSLKIIVMRLFNHQICGFSLEKCSGRLLC